MNILDVVQKPLTTRVHYKICGKHFEDSCFQTPAKIKLNRNVVPTILNVKPDLLLQEALPGPSHLDLQTTPDVSTCSPEIGMTDTSPDKWPYNILHMVDETRMVNLTPKKRKYYRELVKAKHLIATMKRRHGTCAKKLFQGSTDIFSNSIMKAMEKLEKMPRVVQLFIHSQLRNVHKQSKARRYTCDEKSFYIALQKSSPRGYRQMGKFFSMPSSRTLNRFLQNFSLKCGINNQIFSYLNKSSESMSQQDRVCILMFDEVSLKPNLYYNRGTQKVDGLEQLNEECSYKIAISILC